jgi:sulfur transfer protein SufE
VGYGRTGGVGLGCCSRTWMVQEGSDDTFLLSFTGMSTAELWVVNNQS